MSPIIALPDNAQLIGYKETRPFQWESVYKSNDFLGTEREFLRAGKAYAYHQNRPIHTLRGAAMRIVDPAENYEDTAQAWATRIDQPFPTDSYGVHMCVGLMQGIWRGIDKETIETIETDPAHFAARVAAYRHNLSMQHTEEL